jgi:hypothetical protein
LLRHTGRRQETAADLETTQQNLNKATIPSSGLRLFLDTFLRDVFTVSTVTYILVSALNLLLDKSQVRS